MGAFFKRLLERVDGYQRTHAWIGFPFAVAKKFGEDRAGNLAALVAYYSFFSLFPLLMVLTAILGFVLQDNAELQDRIVDSALTQFPVIGPQIRENIGSISGSGIALGVGLATALWAGMGVTNAFQYALNSVWDVPIRRRPTFVFRRVRSLLMLAILGSLTIAGAFLSGLGGGGSAIGLLLRVVGIAAGLAVNLALFMLAFRILTNRELSWREVFPGAAFAAVAWGLLQVLGTWFVRTRLASAEHRYGEFAFVIGLLVWIYVGAQLTLFAAEANVVKAFRLWPRSLRPDSRTEADERALTRLAEVEQHRRDQDVDVRFEREARGRLNIGEESGSGRDGNVPEPDDAVARARKALDEAREAVEDAKQAVERRPGD